VAFDPSAVPPLVLALSGCVVARRFARELVDPGAKDLMLHCLEKGDDQQTWNTTGVANSVAFHFHDAGCEGC
jgi:hypothetical protein